MTTTAAHGNAAASAARGRGRPPNSAQAIEQRRGEIIAAAYEVFAEKGYHAAGIADIAARLDIGHGTFYRYFDNKRDILDHVVDHGVQHFLSVVMPDSLPDATDREELRAQLVGLGRRAFGIIDDDPRLPQLILFEVGAVDAELLQRVLGMLETVRVLIEPLLDNGVERGFLRADLDVEATSRALIGCVISGLFAHVRSPLSGKARARYIDTVASLVCDNAPPARTQRPKKDASR